MCKIEEARMARIFQRREQASLTVGRDGGANPDFIGFKDTFLANIDKLRTNLLSVYSEPTIDLNELYNLTDSIFLNIENKVDTILYLNAIYSSEYYTVEHCLRVGLLANIFAKWLGLDDIMTRDITAAGFLHDIGMFQVPQAVIEKEGVLTPDELSLIRQHPGRGAVMLADKGVCENILSACRSHHERYDGSGYPRRKKQHEIEYFPSLISIVDTYDSMTSNRPYSPAMCPFDVVNYFERQMIDKFDPSLLYVFLENVPHMYNNAIVRLSNGEEAVVVFINKNDKTSPIVQLNKNGEFIDLSRNRNIKIESIL